MRISRGPFFAILLGLAVFSSYAQNEMDETDTSSPGALSPARANAIQIDPLSLYYGAIGANFEHLFAPKHGLMVQTNIGLTSKYKGYGLGIQYRRHYKSGYDQRGIGTAFWGPFVNLASYTSEITQTTSTSINNGPAETSTSIVPYKITYAAIGLNWGRRVLWDSGFNIVWRIGYGFPIADITIKDSENKLDSEAKSSVTALMKILSGIDGELSIGIAF